MILKGFLGIMMLSLSLSGHAFAREQFGIYGLQSQTSHEVLPHPFGFGAFLQKDLSALTSFHFSYSWAKDSDKFISTISKYGGFGPASDTIRDFWLQDASMQVIDLSLMLKAVRNEVISLSVGPGLGLARFNRSVVGKATNFHWGGDSDFRLSFSAVADFEIAHRKLYPLIVHLSVRERITAASIVTATDSPAPFRASIRSAAIVLAIAYRLR